jgi:tRNA modification GTPase
MIGTDTIVACATPWGRGATSLIRLSGVSALAIARELCPGGPKWRPRRASLRRVLDEGEVIDEVLALWMPAPTTYTGEDTVELSGHGNPVLVEALIDRCLRAGARMARPGEFTRRAVEHGRMDLLRAEAVAELIRATSPAGVSLARHGLDGGLQEAVGGLRERLMDLAAELEARLDHPGDDLAFHEDAEVVGLLEAVAADASGLADGWRAGRIRLEGARVALVGPVNAGKSSLFNALVGVTRALVSPEPGTTRDVVEKSVLIDGLDVTFYDTAGERGDAVGLEAAGQALGRELTEAVDLRVVVMPLHRPWEGPPALAAQLVVGTHEDRLDGPPAWSLERTIYRVDGRTGAGIAGLRVAIRDHLAAAPTDAAALTTQRQHDLLRAIAGHARASAAALSGPLGPAVAAEECTRALMVQGELTGEDVREGVLDRLFARFCVGK